MGGKRRTVWPLLLAAAIAVAAVWVLYAVGRSPHRDDLATYWGFAVAVVALAAGRIAGHGGVRGRNRLSARQTLITWLTNSWSQ